MPVYGLDQRLAFPDPALADASGLLAVGGDLSPRRLLLAYSNGIFPWYAEDQPILWHAPNPRFAMAPTELHIPRRMRSHVNQNLLEHRFDTAFGEVIEACASAPRPGQDGTWILPEMSDAYQELHRLGFAHSAEAWRGTELVAGLYGVSLGAAFFAESMFTREDNASKVLLIRLIQTLGRWGFTLFDCQMNTAHMARFGAKDMSRSDFQTKLAAALDAMPTRRGLWDWPTT